MPFLDFKILIDISPKETARRLYEIEQGTNFSEKFVEQYMEKEGSRYKTYLDAIQAQNMIDIVVDGEFGNMFWIKSQKD